MHSPFYNNKQAGCFGRLCLQSTAVIVILLQISIDSAQIKQDKFTVMFLLVILSKIFTTILINNYSPKILTKGIRLHTFWQRLWSNSSWHDPQIHLVLRLNVKFRIVFRSSISPFHNFRFNLKDQFRISHRLLRCNNTNILIITK